MIPRILYLAVLLLSFLLTTGSPAFSQAPIEDTGAWVPDYQEAARRLEDGANFRTDAASCTKRVGNWMVISKVMGRINNLIQDYKDRSRSDLSLEGQFGSGDWTDWLLRGADIITPYGFSLLVGNKIGNAIHRRQPDTNHNYTNDEGKTVGITLNGAAGLLNIYGGALHRATCCQCLPPLIDSSEYAKVCSGNWTPPDGQMYKKHCVSNQAAVTQATSEE
jgi:hypothetical protein